MSVCCIAYRVYLRRFTCIMIKLNKSADQMASRNLMKPDVHKI